MRKILITWEFTKISSYFDCIGKCIKSKRENNRYSPHLLTPVLY